LSNLELSDAVEVAAVLDSIGETGEYSLNNVATGPDNEDCHSAAPFNRHSSVELFTPGYDQHE